MKKITIIIITILTLGFFSCQEEDIEVIIPTFKVTSFEKVLDNGIYNCKATIAITDIVDDYSIDGIIYANDITKILHNLPYNEDLLYDIHSEGDDKLFFNLFGEHKGDLTIQLEWISEENRENYLVGWHLSYGFGPNCQVLIINLNNN